MALIRKELFTAALVANPRVAHNVPYGIARGHGRAHEAFAAQPNAENAEKLYDQLADYIKAGGQLGKSCRPWDITIDVFADLDRTQPWWGWEFETGWRTHANLLAAVNHTWDNFDGCMFDGEGEGEHQVEITFTPSEMSRYFDGTAPAYQYMKWMSDNAHLTNNTGTNNVGTHLNISDPRFTDTHTVEKLVRFMNRTLKFTQRVNGQRKRMFGRESIYAGFFHNISNGGANQWIEFKGYRTTYKIEEFEDYLKSAAALQKVVDYFFSKPIAELEGRGISNLYAIAYEGDRPRRSKVEYYNPAPGALPLFTRRYGGEDGGSIT